MVAIAHPDAVLDAIDGAHLRVGVEVEFRAEAADGVVAHGRVGERSDESADAEHPDLDAEAAQRLPEFEPDHAGAEDGDGLRQIVPREDIVVHDEPVGGAAEHVRDRRRRTGGDHGAREVDARVVVHLDRRGTRELRAARHAMRLGDALDARHDEADEAVALALHAGHHGCAIHLHRAFEPQAEGVPLRRTVRGLGRGDQQLARHAAHAGAGRAVGAGLDDHGAPAGRDGRAVRREAGSPGTDDGDVGGDGVHGACPFRDADSSFDRGNSVMSSIVVALLPVLRPALHRGLPAGRRDDSGAGMSTTPGPRVPAARGDRVYSADCWSRAYAAFACRLHASSSSAPPMYSPLMKICGTVPLPVTAPTTRLRTVCASGTSA